MIVLLNIITWCNTNAGFLSALLTTIYIGATVFILIANQKSVDVMKQSINNENDAHQQDVNIQLFEVRFVLIKDLQEQLKESHKDAINPNNLLEKVLSNANYTIDLLRNVERVKYLFSKTHYDTLNEVLQINKDISVKNQQIRTCMEVIEKKDSHDFELVNEYIKKHIYGYSTSTDESYFVQICANNEIYDEYNPSQKLNINNLLNEVQDLHDQYSKKVEMFLNKCRECLIINFGSVSRSNRDTLS